MINKLIWAYRRLAVRGEADLLRALDRELLDLAGGVNNWLDDRETKQLGCAGRYEDCVGWDKSCGWLRADGGCRLGRR